MQITAQFRQKPMTKSNICLLFKTSRRHASLKHLQSFQTHFHSGWKRDKVEENAADFESPAKSLIW